MAERTEKTETTRSAGGQVRIGAPVQRVWRALTEGAELERWFPLEARVEPGEGGSVWLSWKNEFAGSSEILKWRPPHVLAYAWGWSEDAPPQVTEYVLEAEGGSTLLRVVTSGFAPDASWDDLVEATRLGWSFELRSLRSYLEDHDGADRHVAYFRRRVPYDRAELARRLFGDDGLARHAPPGLDFDFDPDLQLARVLEHPADGLFRLSSEPSHAGGGRTATVWISGWGPVAGEIRRLEEEWRRRLEEALPDGETLPD